MATNYAASGSLAVAMAVGNIFASIMLYKVRTVQVADIDNICSASDYVGHRIITLILALLFCSVYSVFTVNAIDYAPVAAYILFKAIESFVDVLHGVDQKNDHFNYIGISQISRGILIVISFIVGLLIFQSLTVSILLMALTSAIVLIVFDMNLTSKLDKLRPVFRKEKMKVIFSKSTSGFFSLLICTTVISVIRQMFSMEYGNEALGSYAAIAAPTVIVQAAASFIYTPLIGPLAISWLKSDRLSFLKIVLKFIIVLIVIVLACILIFHWFGLVAFNFVFQKDMSEYMYLVTPLLICTGLTAAVYFVLDLLIITEENTGAVVSSVASLIAAFCVMNAMFELAGANGISFSIIIAQIVNLLVATVFLIWRILRKNENKHG
ncbi:hypothetical protein [Adlercreutzia sp. ZJ154]|uniref:hypothetical protein n=1 Tax=Adlercreutzia sp. ZJ154 TaxID=2709790 RepID=UPI0013EC5100|nr:hypothetical protein [Adlercreutzia sp. ZJ154]